MTQNRFVHPLWLGLAVVTSVILLSGCSGGGNGGGHGKLLLITADGASEPLWSNGTVPGVCPAGVFVNATIRFTFDAGVDPSSLPGGGVAVGSINITTALTDIPAQGTFTVEDDPAHPAGNDRVVVFRPTLPNNPAATCSAGIMPSQIYQVSLPAGQGQVVVVGGGEITQSAFTCFTTCGCPDPGACIATFMDPVPGAPFVLDTTPTTADPAPPAIDACSITDDTVIIRVNEPLDPNGIDLTNVRIINVATGAQVAGTLVFHQAGNTTGADTISQIDYVASAPFAGSRTYQIVFGPGVKDLAGNPIQTVPLLFFQTLVTPSSPQPPLVENFDNPGQTSGAAAWTGDGFLRATFPTELVGTGADGPFNPAVGAVTILDTNELVNGISRQGIWNFTTVTIQPTATVRIIGPYLAHFRCQGSCLLLGIIQVIPGQATPPVTSTPAYDKGAQTGQQQNGLGTDCEANGGVGNAGAGAGGAGSGITPPPGSPANFQCQVRALKGENGYGPTLNGLPNDGTVPNPFYAGGQGGISGCFPSLSPCTTSLTELGGLGGAGGTAARIGDPGAPRLGTCLLNPSVTQPVAQPQGTNGPNTLPTAMIPPISMQSAGSGGGGGGDHIEAAGTPPNNDDQGGGGGGSGGGFRISCGGAYLQGGTGQINASGINGGNASNASGAGGSGSGGEVWIQAFGSANFNPTALIAVLGAARLFPSAGLIGCSAQASGGGGHGLVQVESGFGPPPGSFNIQPTPTPTTGAVFINPPFIHAGGVVHGQGRSDFRYVGPVSPDYTGAVEVFSLGNAAGATVMIRYEGAQEAVNSTVQVPVIDPTTIKSMATGGGPITAANLDELDGYPFIRFFVDFSYPAPPMTPPSAILPSVDSITINFSAPTCP